MTLSVLARRMPQTKCFTARLDLKDRFFRIGHDATSKSNLGTGRFGIGKWPLWIVAATLLAAGAIRYAQQPSFWLDEAFVAVSLRSPSAETIFARLEYAQYFPRLYLCCVALLRHILGYQIWVLRLLPLLSFGVASLFWVRVLAQRARPFAFLNLLSAVLLLGAGFWLDQAIQLKPYTLDVLFALVPFLVGDGFFKRSLAEGKHKALICALAIPCLVSYTYPFALGARVIGWYVDHGRRVGWRVDASASLVLLVTVALSLAGIWATDYRFNLMDGSAYTTYWNHCILRTSLQQGTGTALRLLAKFLWGWHGRQPLVTAGMVPLQILGVRSVLFRWKNGARAGRDSSWGSRSIGSIVLLAGVVLASALLNYPICAGRVTLFAQVHTQILALEGALFVLSYWNTGKAVTVLLYAFVAVVMFHSGREYGRFVRSEAPENIRPLLPIIQSGIASTLWVHSCSVAQVRSLPNPLPVQEVVLGTQGHPQRGAKILVLWTHLGAESCRKELDQLRGEAHSWQILHAGPDRGLALAEF
jgi:hypothetical protein